jgi:putative aldouronate transport system substrate-binding protein
MKDVMRYFDFMYSDEGKQIASWGKEGETYTVENGKNKYKPEYTSFADLRIKTGIVTPGSYVAMDFDAYVNLSSPQLKDAFKMVEGFEAKPQPRPAFNEKEMETLSTIGQAVNKHRDENIAKFVMGQRNISEWNQYVDEIKNLGLQKMMDEYKAAYERTLKNMGSK